MTAVAAAPAAKGRDFIPDAAEVSFLRILE
jgi:hypothetical protein